MNKYQIKYLDIITTFLKIKRLKISCDLILGNKLYIIMLYKIFLFKTGQHSVIQILSHRRAIVGTY